MKGKALFLIKHKRPLKYYVMNHVIFSLLLFFAISTSAFSNEIFEDSFKTIENHWKLVPGYAISKDEQKYLMSQGTQDKAIWLNKDLPEQVVIEFFMNMPELNARSGFVLKSHNREDVLRFHCSGINYISEDKDLPERTSTELNRINEEGFKNIYSTGISIFNKKWHHIRIVKEFERFSIFLNNQYLTNFELNEKSVRFGLWNSGEEIVYFDELIFKNLEKLSGSINSHTPSAYHQLPNDWNINSGKWEQIYLPSLKRTVLMKNTPENAELLYNSPLHDNYTFNVRFKFNSDGDVGIILNKNSSKQLAVQFSSDSKYQLNLIKTINGNDLVLNKIKMPIYPGIWYDIKVIYTGWDYSVFVNNVKKIHHIPTSYSSGKVGLYSDRSSLVLFDNVGLELKEKKKSYLALKDLTPENISNDDWKRTRNFYCPSNQEKNILSFFDDLTSKGYLSTSIKTGNDFKLLVTYFSSLNLNFELNFFKINKLSYVVLLCNQELVKLKKGNSNKIKALEKAYQSKRNIKYFPLSMIELENEEQFGLQVGHTNVVNKDIENLLPISVNGKLLFSLPVNEENSFTLEMTGLGEVALENFIFKRKPDSKPSDQFKTLNNIEVLNGVWTWEGASLDEKSIGIGKSIVFQPKLSKNFSFKVNLKKLNVGDIYAFNVSNQDEKHILKTQFTCAEEGQITISGYLGKKSLFENNIASFNDFSFTLKKYENDFSWFFYDRNISSQTIQYTALSSLLTFTRIAGDFKFNSMEMTAFPDLLYPLSSPERFLKDTLAWQPNNIFKNSFFEINNNSYIKVSTVSEKAQFTEPLPSNFLMSLFLDYMNINDIAHEFSFITKENTYQCVLMPVQQGCYIEIKKNNKKVFSTLTTKRKFNLGVAYSNDGMKLLIDGLKVGFAKWKSSAKNVSLKMGFKNGTKNQYIAIRNIAFFMGSGK